jgi:DNA-binding response OmpR family regulator
MTKPVYKILVVDDDPKILEVIADVLKEGGYAVDTAPDGTKAIRSIDKVCCYRPQDAGD